MAGVALVVVVLISGVAMATIPDAGGLIHGCYKTSNPAKGSLLVIDTDAGEACPSGTIALNWKQSDTQVLDVIRVQESTALNGQGFSTSTSASCPTGYVLTGGGWETDPITNVEPAKAAINVSLNNYAVTVFNQTTNAATLFVQAVCARLVGG